MRSTPRTITLSAALLLTVGLGISSCSSTDDASSDSAAASTASDTAASAAAASASEGGEDTAVFDIAVGDCFNLPNSNNSLVEKTNVIDCEQPHTYEVIAEKKTELAEFDEQALVAEAETFCNSSFADYIGVAPEMSSLVGQYFIPAASTWRLKDDRSILCIVGDPEQKTTGSLKGAAR